MNHADRFCQTLLFRPLAPASFEDNVRSGFFAERIVAEKGQDTWPLRDDWLAHVPFPTVIDLLHGAESGGHIFLSEAHSQPPIAQMLAKRLR